MSTTPQLPSDVVDDAVWLVDGIVNRGINVALYALTKLLVEHGVISEQVATDMFYEPMSREHNLVDFFYYAGDDSMCVRVNTDGSVDHFKV